MPRLRLPTLFALSWAGFSALVVALIVGAYWPWLDRALALEDSPIVWWQTSLLLTSAVVAGLHFVLVRRPRWLLIAAALLGAALDERFMGHERVKEWLRYDVFAGDAARMAWLGDAPMLAYALGATLVLAVLWRESGRAVRGLLAAAAVAACAAVALDLLYDTVGPQIVEEGIEVLAETLFACGLLLHVTTAIERLGAGRNAVEKD